MSYRKLRLLYDKSLRQDAHEREDVICRKRPRSARECAEAHSFLWDGLSFQCIFRTIWARDHKFEDGAFILK